MCCPLRCTVRRGTASLRMCMRVDLARRRRAVFFSMYIFLGSGSAALVRSAAMDGRFHTQGCVLSLLGFLERDAFAGVAHTLALVRLGWTERADLGGGFADALLVGTLDQDFGLGRRLDRHA